MQGKNIATGTRMIDQPCQVPGPVTNQRSSFLAQGGDHHFADLTG